MDLFGILNNLGIFFIFYFYLKMSLQIMDLYLFRILKKL